MYLATKQKACFKHIRLVKIGFLGGTLGSNQNVFPFLVQNFFYL